MADSSLEEFFAKKDKSKKNKLKTKFTTSATIAKQLEDGGKKADYVKKDIKEKIVLPSNLNSASIPNSGEKDIFYTKEDDEWKNAEEEKERDYSGLRIQALSISEKEKEEEQLKEQLAEQNGEMFKTSDGRYGPWKMGGAGVATAISPPSPTPIEEEPIVETPEPEIVSDTPKPVVAYKPPAMRNVSASASPSSVSRRHPKSAPQISSEVHFPSLSSAADNGKGKFSDSDPRSFQSVKHGIRSKGETQPGLQLDLENKFSALHHGQGDQL